MDMLVEVTEESLSEKFDLPDGVLVSQIRDDVCTNMKHPPLKGARKRLAKFTGECVLKIVDKYEEIIIAGGAVTACLADCFCGDIDLYICTENNRIRTLVLNCIVNELKNTDLSAVVRSKFALGIVDSTGLTAQIVLTSDSTPENVLQHFDVDSCCFCYTKKKFFGLKRGIRALQTRTNVVDMDRRTYAYEFRLVKYYKRGFDVLLPNVNIDDLCQEKLKKEKHGVALLARHNKIWSPAGIRSYYEGTDKNAPWSIIATAYNAILHRKQPTTVGSSIDHCDLVIDEGKFPTEFVELFTSTTTCSRLGRLDNAISLVSQLDPEFNGRRKELTAILADRLEYATQKLHEFAFGPIEFTSSDKMKCICARNMTEKQKNDWLCLRDV
jgi:hypothetical protein